MSNPSDTLSPVFGILAVNFPTLAIYACAQGYQRKIVVYAGRGDLHLTIFSLLSVVLTTIAFGAEAGWIAWLLLVVAAVLLSLSFERAVKANRTFWHAMLSMIAKYSLLAVIVPCAMLAVSGALAAVEEAKQKRYKEAAQQAAVSAAGAVGFVAVQRLISRLIADRSPPIIAGTEAAR